MDDLETKKKKFIEYIQNLPDSEFYRLWEVIQTGVGMMDYNDDEERDLVREFMNLFADIALHDVRSEHSQLTQSSPLTKSQKFQVYPGESSQLLQWLQKQYSKDEFDNERRQIYESLANRPDVQKSFKEKWDAFMHNYQESDEVWYFTSPPDTWNRLMGRSGYVIVSNKECKYKWITELN